MTTETLPLPPLPVEEPEPEVSSCSQEWMAKQPLHWWVKAALADLRACEEDPQYGIHMGTWHTPGGYFNATTLAKDKCYVCLAGSVMAQHLQASRVRYLGPDFYELVSRHLEALDSIRRGMAPVAVAKVYGYDSHQYDVMSRSSYGRWETPPRYEPDRAEFYAYLEKLQAFLELHNI